MSDIMLKPTEERNKQRLYTFETYGEFTNESKLPGRWKINSSVSESKEKSWDLGVGYNGAVKMIDNGWPEGRDRLDQSIDLAASLMKPQTIKPYFMDVGGAFPIVPLAVAGDPQCMLNIGDTSKASKPIVYMLIHTGASAMVNAETMVNRGAAILSWCDAIEGLGYRVGIEILDASFLDESNKSEAWITSFPLKRPQDALDIDRAAFALIHPAFMRRLWFRVLERLPIEYERKIGWGYGMPLDVPTWVKELYPQSIYFESLFGYSKTAQECQTMQGALGYVKRCVEQVIGSHEEE